MPSRVRIILRDAGGNFYRGHHAIVMLRALYSQVGKPGSIDPLTGMATPQTFRQNAPPENLPKWRLADWFFQRLPGAYRKIMNLWLVRDRRHLKWKNSKAKQFKPISYQTSAAQWANQQVLEALQSKPSGTKKYARNPKKHIAAVALQRPDEDESPDPGKIKIGIWA